MDSSSVFVVFCVVDPLCTAVLLWGVPSSAIVCDVIAWGGAEKGLTIIDEKVKHYDKKG